MLRLSIVGNELQCVCVSPVRLQFDRAQNENELSERLHDSSVSNLWLSGYVRLIASFPSKSQCQAHFGRTEINILSPGLRAGFLLSVLEKGTFDGNFLDLCIHRAIGAS